MAREAKAQGSAARCGGHPWPCPPRNTLCLRPPPSPLSSSPGASGGPLSLLVGAPADSAGLQEGFLCGLRTKHGAPAPPAGCRQKHWASTLWGPHPSRVPSYSLLEGGLITDPCPSEVNRTPKVTPRRGGAGTTSRGPDSPAIPHPGIGSVSSLLPHVGTGSSHLQWSRSGEGTHFTDGKTEAKKGSS